MIRHENSSDEKMWGKGFKSRRYFQVERAQIDKDVRNAMLMGSEDTDLSMGLESPYYRSG